MELFNVDFLCLPLFTQPNDFEIDSCCIYAVVVHSFPLLSGVSIVQLYHIFIIHLPVDGSLSCFQFLATVNKISVHICVQILV